MALAGERRKATVPGLVLHPSKVCAAADARKCAPQLAPLSPRTNGNAKIAGIKLCQACRKQHGCDFVSAMPTNLYGPDDNFDLKTSRIIPALLRKVHEAKERADKELVVWGTGTPRREFLYVDDAADALVHLMKV